MSPARETRQQVNHPRTQGVPTRTKASHTTRNEGTCAVGGQSPTQGTSTIPIQRSKLFSITKISRTLNNILTSHNKLRHRMLLTMIRCILRFNTRNIRILLLLNSSILGRLIHGNVLILKDSTQDLIMKVCNTLLRLRHRARRILSINRLPNTRQDIRVSITLRRRSTIKRLFSVTRLNSQSFTRSLQGMLVTIVLRVNIRVRMLR